MNIISTTISGLFVVAVSSPAVAAEIKTVNIGEALVVYDFQPAGEKAMTLTLNALVAETNDALRGLKNSDRRRLSKLGELIYQCKLLLSKSAISDRSLDLKAPFLISRNYSLYTGVDRPLAADERVGIQAQTLQAVDGDSLFSTSLGDRNMHQEVWETLGEGAATNLYQLNVNLLHESDIIETAESIDISIRFPVFQLEQPVRQWHYNFILKDFKQAVQHADENCTPVKFIELMQQQS